MKTIQCDKCHGTGMKGQYEQWLGAFIDYECPKCRGKGYIESKKKSNRQKQTKEGI